MFPRFHPLFSASLCVTGLESQLILMQALIEHSVRQVMFVLSAPSIAMSPNFQNDKHARVDGI